MSVILAKKRFGLGFNLLRKRSFTLKETSALFLFFSFGLHFLFPQAWFNLIFLHVYLFLRQKYSNRFSSECHYAFTKAQIRVSQVVLKSDQLHVAHNIDPTENILHHPRFPTVLESQNTLLKSSGGSDRVGSCFRVWFCLFRDLRLNLQNKILDYSNFSPRLSTFTGIS